MTRKQFLHSALGACAGVLGLAVLGSCNDETSPRADGGPSRDGNLGGGNTIDGGGGGNNTVDGGTSGGPMDAPTPEELCLRDGTVSTIGSNHGHILVVTKEDVAAGNEKIYNIQGTATHPHSVTITRAHFEQLAQDNAISTVSTTDSGHSHSIVVACA